MATVGNLRAKMVADIRPFRQEMKRTADEVRRVDRSMSSLGSTTTTTDAAFQSHGSTVVDVAGKVAKFTAAHAATVIALKGAEKAIRSNTAATATLSGHLAKASGLFTSAAAASSKFAGGLKTATKLMLGRFLPGIGVLLGAAGLVGLTRRLTEFGAQAANVRPVTQAFDNLAEHVGTTGEVLRRDLKQAVSSTVSDFDLMQSSVIALNSEAIKSPEVLAELAESARILGRTVGVETTAAFDKLIRGVGLMRPQLLKDLGVMVSVNEATRNWAEANNRAVGSLTDAERHTAFLVAVLEETREATGRVGNETDDLGTILQQADAAAADFAIKMQEAVAEAEGIRRANKDWAEIRLILNELRRDTLPGIASAFANAVGQATHFLVTGPLERFLSGEMLNTDATLDTADAWRRVRQEVEGVARAVDVLSATGPQGFGVGGEILLPPPTGTGIDRPARPLVPGFETFGEMNERARRLTEELRRAISGISGLETRFGPDIAGLLGDPSRIRGRFMPGGQIGDLLARSETLDLATPGRAQDVITDQNFGDLITPPEIKEAAESFDDAAAITVASFGSMAEAAVRGSEQMEVSFIRGITSILQSLPGVGGVASAAIGAIGGIFSGFAGAFAHGGRVPGGQFGLVAEAGRPEMVSRPSLVGGPAQVTPQGGGGGGPSAGQVAGEILSRLGPKPTPMSPREVALDSWHREAHRELRRWDEETRST